MGDGDCNTAWGENASLPPFPLSKLFRDKHGGVKYDGL